ncbi:MAG: S1C family serine protease [Chitinophagales bacterium]
MKIRHILAVILLSVSSAFITFYFLNKVAVKAYQVEPLPQTPAAPTKAVAFNSMGETNFTTAAAKATPAVVHVKTSIEVNTSQSRQFYGDDVFEWFFGQQNPYAQKGTRKQSLGSGSGVIVSEDGYIVTNNHVIDKANKIEVVLSNNKVYNAELVGRDKDTDLAVLKIDEINLPTLAFANSDHVSVGEWVLAVGNPFNLSSTVTAGIVSAKGRNINILENFGAAGNTAIESFIQTDAAVNPGNSGGALVNTKGELMGINTAIATPTGSFAGYSFAVPSNLVNKVVTDIKQFGSAQRAYLGVSISNVNTEMAHKLQLEDMNGVYIAKLLVDGAAYDAGLEIGDVVVAIDGEKMNTTSELQEKIAEYRPEEIVEVEYFRNGKREITNIMLK